MNDLFSKFSRGAGHAAAHPMAFVLALLSVVVWAGLGPLLRYSDGWQLVINTSTTILTFLMMFLLQNSQNRDSRAVQVKLDELLRAVDGARNELIDLEELSEEELSRYAREFHELHLHYTQELEQRGKPDIAKAAIAKAAENVRAARPSPAARRDQRKGK